MAWRSPKTWQNDIDRLNAANMNGWIRDQQVALRAAQDALTARVTAIETVHSQVDIRAYSRHLDDVNSVDGEHNLGGNYTDWRKISQSIANFDPHVTAPRPGKCVITVHCIVIAHGANKNYEFSIMAGPGAPSAGNALNEDFGYAEVYDNQDLIVMNSYAVVWDYDSELRVSGGPPYTFRPIYKFNRATPVDDVRLKLGGFSMICQMLD